MHSGFRGFPIRLKLLSSAMVVLLPISLFISFYFPGREEAIALAAMRDRTTNMAELVALGVGRGMRLNDFSDVVSAVKWVKQDSSLAYVVVVDQAGEVFASYNPRKVKLDAITWYSRNAVACPVIVQVKSYVTSAGGAVTTAWNVPSEPA